MNQLSNLPPFYVGQKVVCLTAFWKQEKSFMFLKRWVKVNHGPAKNDTVTVHSIYYSGEWYIKLAEHSKDNGYQASQFAPLEQNNFPLMTFSEIKVKENQEILIPN